MIPLRTAAVIDAPIEQVDRALRLASTWRRSATAIGGSCHVDDEVLTAGERVRGRKFLPLSLFDHWTVDPERPGELPDRPSSDARIGPILCAADGSTVAFTAVPTAAGVSITAEVRLPRLSTLRGTLLRRRILRAMELLLGVVTLVAREPRIVVAGAWIRQGAVLAARRRPGLRAAGGWEFPGGSVEAGESEGQALQREWQEELGLTVRVDEPIGGQASIGPHRVLRLFQVQVVDPPAVRRDQPEASAPPLTSTDHDQLRWLTADELEQVSWLPADRPFLPWLAPLLGADEGIEHECTSTS